MLNACVAQRQRVGQDPDLADDLAGGEVADQAHLAGEAERAGHGAPDLGRDAEGHAGRVGDEHRLDLPAVGEPQQELLGAVDRALAADERGVVSVKSAARAARSSFDRSVIAVGIGDAAPVDPGENLAGPEPLVVPARRKPTRAPGDPSRLNRAAGSRYLSRGKRLSEAVFDLTAAVQSGPRFHVHALARTVNRML